MQQGVLYFATGDAAFLDELLVSVQSLKRVMPDVPVTLVTDLDTNGPFDQLLRAPPGRDPLRRRIEALCDSPYERTLYLDCDTYLVRDVSELFVLLDSFDLAVAHDANRIPVQVPGLPDSYPEFNCGVIAFRASALRSLRESWLDLYDRFGEKLSEAEAKPWLHDQSSFREAIYKSGLRVATLPPEFNCRFLIAGFYNISVAILHAHASEDQFKKAARVMSDLHPAYWSQYVHYDRQVWGPHGSSRKLLDLRHPLRRYRAYRGLLKLLGSAYRTLTR